jgi:hypothetical protein
MDKIVRIKQEVTRVIKVQPERVVVGDIGLPIEIEDVNELPEALQALSDEITDLQENIPVQISRYFRDQTETIFGQLYRLALPDPGAPPVVNITQSVTGTTRETAQLIEQFAGPQAVDNINISGEIRVKIQAEKNSTPRSVFLFAEFWHMLTDGTLQLKGTSGDIILDNAAGSFDIGIPVEAYIAETGTRGIVRFRSYQTGGGAAATATISIEGNTLSRWAYVQALGEFPHNLLRGRDALNAHPISAITGLQDELDNVDISRLRNLQDFTVISERPTAHPAANNPGATISFVFDDHRRELLEPFGRPGGFPGFKAIFDEEGVKFGTSVVFDLVGPNKLTISEMLAMQSEGYEFMAHLNASQNLSDTLEEARTKLAARILQLQNFGLNPKNGNWFQGQSSPSYRSAVRSFFRSAGGGSPRNIVVDQFRYPRHDIDNGNYNSWVARVDAAFNEGRFECLFGHAYYDHWYDQTFDDDGNPDPGGDFIWQKIQRIIQYIKTKPGYGQNGGIRILTIDEALDYHGNAIDIGDRTIGNCLQVSKTGNIFVDGLGLQKITNVYDIGGDADEQVRVGYEAGALSTGAGQVAVGRGAGAQNTGFRQTAVGRAAGSQNTGDSQIAVGRGAGDRNSGIDQLAFGRESGLLNSGLQQVALGVFAGRENTADYNISIGSDAGRNNTGVDTVAIGREAGRQNNSLELTAVGTFAGYQNKSIRVTAVGRGAGYQNEGAESSFFGHRSGFGNKGADATAIGRSAGAGNTGLILSALGKEAGELNTGNYVIGIGFQAAKSNTGNGVIALGYQAGLSNSEGSVFLLRQAHLNTNPLIKGYFISGAIVIGAPATELASASMGNSRLTFWIDEATNELKIKIKKSDGTTRVSTIATI